MIRGGTTDRATAGSRRRRSLLLLLLRVDKPVRRLLRAGRVRRAAAKSWTSQMSLILLLASASRVEVAVVVRRRGPRRSLLQVLLPYVHDRHRADRHHVRTFHGVSETTSLSYTVSSPKPKAVRVP